MAIRMRYGLESEFDPSKMVVGEWAVSTDTRYVRMCFAPGIVLRMATYEAFEADMAQIETILAECKDIQTAITRIQSEVNAKAVLCAKYADSAKESADAAAESAEKAKLYADNASAVTGVQIATQDIAGLMRGGDNYVDESGALVLTARTDSGVLENSHEGGIRLHSISAVEDRQETTTGAQLFDADNPTLSAIISDGIVTNYDSYNLYSIPVTIGAEYTLTKSACVNAAYLGFYYEIPTAGVTLTDRANITEVEELNITATDYYLCLMFAKSEDCSVVMLNAGTEALPWEPYTGGKPSPAPGEAVVTSTNQLKLNETKQTVNGVTSNPDTYNQIAYLVGDATDEATFIVGTAKLEAGTYYASCSSSSLLDNMNTVYEYAVKDANANELVYKNADTSKANSEDAFTLTEAQTVTFEITVSKGEMIDCEFSLMIATTSGATWDAYAVEYTEGYPQEIKGTVGKNFFSAEKIVATLKRIASTAVTYNGDDIVLNKVSSNLQERFGVAIIAPFTGEFTLSLEETELYAFGLSVYDELPSVAEQTTVTTVTAKKGQYLVLSCVVSTDYVGESTLSNIMIRPAEILDPTYVPYGCLRVVGHGKNLVKNCTTESTATQYYGTIKAVRALLKKGVEYTVSAEITASARTQLYWNNSPGVFDNKYFYVSAGTAKYSYTFIAKKDYRYNTLAWLSKNLNDGVTVSAANVQVEYGPTATDYSPHTEQSIILSQPFSEFHNIGGVGDKLTPEAEVRRFATVVFDGSDDEGWIRNATGAPFFQAPLLDAKGTNNAKCTHYRYATGGVTTSNEAIGFNLGSYVTRIRFRPENSADLTLDDWKDMLATSPITVVYELAEEVTTALPTESQIALHSLKSYPGVTHLYTDTYPQMVIDCEYGTSKVGAVAFEGYNAGRRSEIRAEANYNELAAALLALSQE